LRLSRLAFGCARLFAGIEARASRRLIEAALGVGIRHFDTAPSYAWGQSERVLGEALAGMKDVTIATKVGIEATGPGPGALGTAYRLIARPVLAHVPRLKARLVRRDQGRATLAPPAVSQRPVSRFEIEASVNRSLERLRRDYIDLLLIHEPDYIRLDEESLGIFLGLQRSGVIRAFGLGYARVITDPPTFGQVLQSHADKPDHARIERADILKVWHGVLRSADSGTAPPAASRPASRIRRAWAERPTDVILFSASSTAQIREVAEATASAAQGTRQSGEGR
jgi:hypothetical protein